MKAPKTAGKWEMILTVNWPTVTRLSPPTAIRALDPSLKGENSKAWTGSEQGKDRCCPDVPWVSCDRSGIVRTTLLWAQRKSESGFKNNSFRSVYWKMLSLSSKKAGLWTSLELLSPVQQTSSAKLFHFCSAWKIDQIERHICYHGSTEGSHGDIHFARAQSPDLHVLYSRKFSSGI